MGYRMLLVLLAVLAVDTVASAQVGSPGSAPPGLANKLGVLVFDLNPNTISPATITVPEGRYIVRVRNGITFQPVPVQLDPENAPRLVEASIRANVSGVQQIVQLKPGKHTLRAGGRAGWTATVIVTEDKSK